MLIVTDLPWESWEPEDLMFGIWERAKEAVPPPFVLKTETIASAVFESWIGQRPAVFSVVESILGPGPDSKADLSLRPLSYLIKGSVDPQDEAQLKELCQGTFFTPYGISLIAFAYCLRNPTMSRTNLIFPDDAESRAERKLASLESGIESRAIELESACMAVLAEKSVPPVIRARAIYEIACRLQAKMREVYETVYEAGCGERPKEGRKRALESASLSRMVDHFVQTNLLGRHASDRDLHPSTAGTIEDHNLATSDITKGNAKIVSYLRHYHQHFCDFCSTPEGPVRSDPIVVPKQPGRPKKSRSTSKSKPLQKLQK